MSGEATLRSEVSGLKAAHLPTFLKGVAHRHGLSIELDIDNHWIRQTVRYTMTGDSDRLRAASKDIIASLEAYNNQD